MGRALSNGVVAVQRAARRDEPRGAPGPDAECEEAIPLLGVASWPPLAPTAAGTGASVNASIVEAVGASNANGGSMAETQFGSSPMRSSHRLWQNLQENDAVKVQLPSSFINRGLFHSCSSQPPASGNHNPLLFRPARFENGWSRRNVNWPAFPTSVCRRPGAPTDGPPQATRQRRGEGSAAAASALSGRAR